MRARNREINIFNMSLLDILCGALGAFCFMMIVLLPYYKPGTGEDAKKQQELDETLKDIDKLKEKLKDAELAKELAELIEKLKQQIRELEGRVNTLVAENADLRKQVAGLAAEKKKLEAENEKLWETVADLEENDPFIIYSWTSFTLPSSHKGEIQLYVWQDQVSEKGNRQPPIDPQKLGNRTFWRGEQTYWVEGPSPFAIWMVNKVRGGNTWKVYARLRVTRSDPTSPGKMVEVPLPAPVELVVGVNNIAATKNFPAFSLTQERPWCLVGFITADKKDNTELTLREATAAEREAEFKLLDKIPPPPPPRPTPESKPPPPNAPPAPPPGAPKPSGAK